MEWLVPVIIIAVIVGVVAYANKDKLRAYLNKRKEARK